MKTLGRNIDNDLYLEAGELAVLHDVDAQCAIIEAVVQTQRGELQFEDDKGIDYFGTVLTSPRFLAVWAAQVRKSIDALDFVSAIEDFTYEFQPSTSTLVWSMVVANKDNERLDLRNKRTTIDGSPGIDVDWANVYDKPEGTDEVLDMVEAMSNEAQTLHEPLSPSNTLNDVKNVINQVVYLPNDAEYAKTRELEFTFDGVPIGTIIDFRNLALDIKDTGGSQPFYAPYTVEISDGAKHRFVTGEKYYDPLVSEDTPQETEITERNNHIWFYDYESDPLRVDDKLYYMRTSRHTITKGGRITIKIKGNIKGIRSIDQKLPIFINSASKAFPYLVKFRCGERIPLEEIGSGAFRDFVNLAQIIWGGSSSVVDGAVLGDYAFSKCQSLTNLDWCPEYLQSIGEFCFDGCSGLTSIDGLHIENQTDIPHGCFRNCTALTSIDKLPSSISKLEAEAFKNCTSLTKIEHLPDGIVSFGEECFFGCSGLVSFLYAPQNLSKIGDACFGDCTSLRALYISSSVSEIGHRAFVGCSSLTNVFAESEEPPATAYDDIFDQEELAIYVPPGARETYAQAAPWRKYWTDTVKTIYEYGIYSLGLIGVGANEVLVGASGAVSSDSVWTVEYTGTNQRNLHFENTEVDFPSFTYTNVPDDGGEGHSSIIVKGYLKSLSGDTVSQAAVISSQQREGLPILHSFEGIGPLERLGDYAFFGSANLETISLTKISESQPFCLGERAFAGCRSLENIGWLNEFPKFGRTVESSTTEYDLDENGNIQYDEDGNPKTKVIFTYYPAFGEGCFYNAGITSLQYPIVYVENIPAYCFAGTKIGTLDGIGGTNLTSLGASCFQGCTLLTSIKKLEDTGVKTLPSQCFADCASLTSIDGIRKIYSEVAEEDGTVTEETGEKVFQNCVSLQSIEPMSYAYGIERITPYMFAGCSSLANLQGIESITELGEYAFSGCSGLTSIRALENASRIEESDTIRLEIIPNYCFANCTGLTTLIGCKYIKSIGEGAFSGCSGILSTTGLGDAISTIGNLAFRNCTALKYVTCISETAPTLPSTAFSGVSIGNIPLYAREGSVANYAANSNWNRFKSIGHRTVKIHLENITEISAVDAANSLLVSIVGTPGDSGDSTIGGIVYVDYGNGEGLKLYYGDDYADATVRLEAMTYSVRGGYDITIFGDVSAIKSINSYAPESALDVDNLNVTPFMGSMARKATAILVDSQYLNSIGDFCFANYGIYQSPLNIRLNTAAKIGAGAFAKSIGWQNYGLVGALEAFGSTSIGDYAFYRSGLTDATLFTTLAKCGKEAFAYNGQLASLIGFSSLQEIGEGAFRSCTSLTETNGMGQVQTIGSYAFEGCSKLATVNGLGSSIATIGSGAFANCGKISTIYIANEVPPTSDGEELLPNVFDDTVFANAILYVPANYESVYEAKFAWSKFGEGLPGRIRSRYVVFTLSGIRRNQTSITWMATIVASGPWSISYGTEQVFTYQAGTYTYSRNQSSQWNIQPYTFINDYDDANPCYVKISGAVTSISCTGDVYPAFGTKIGENQLLTSIEATAAVELSSFGDYAFKGCSKLKSLKGLTSIISVGGHCFEGDVALTDLSGLTNVSTVGDEAFEGCSKMETLYGLHSVTSIGARAFNGCSKLQYIDGLGENVTSIGEAAFASCNLKEVQMFAEEPPSLGDNAFGTLDKSTIPLYVRSKSISAYQSTAIWSQFTNIRSRYIEFTLSNCPANITIDDISGLVMSNTFWLVDWDSYNHSSVPANSEDEIRIPEYTYSLSGNHTFRIEGAVTEIKAATEPQVVSVDGRYIPTAIDGTSFISLSINGSQEFSVEGTMRTYVSEHLTNVSSSEYAALNVVGAGAFLNNTNLEEADLVGVTTIGNSAFAFCSSITSLQLLERVAKIEDNAFCGCIGLENITNLGGRGQSIEIGNYSFAGLAEGNPKYIQVGVSVGNNYSQYPSESVAKITQLSFGYIPDRKDVYVYVPINSVAAYQSDPLWGQFSVASQVINFTLENVPSGTTILGISPEDSVGASRVEANSAWIVDWDDGTKNSMSAEDTSFPAHTYTYNANDLVDKANWTSYTVNGSEVWYRKSITISISGGITFLGTQSSAGSSFLTTVQGGGNPHLTKVLASSGMEQLTALGDSVFRGCTALTSVTGFTAVESIGQYAFQGCSSLVDLGGEDDGFGSVLSIGNLAFSDCTSLVSLATFKSVLTIGIRAFANCISLTGIKGLGKKYKDYTPADWTRLGLTSTFGSYAFTDCSFGAIDIQNYQVPPTIQTTTFPGDPSQVFVIVSAADGVEDSYRKAPVWQNYFRNIIAAAQMSITLGNGIATAGKVFYGANCRLAFKGSYIDIDWGDGTSTQSTVQESGGWTFPNHFYTKENSGPTTITVQGNIYKVYTADANDEVLSDEEAIAALKPAFAFATSVTTTDPITGETTITVSDEKDYDFQIKEVSFGSGNRFNRIGTYFFKGSNIGSVFFGKPNPISESGVVVDKRMQIGAGAFLGCRNITSVTGDEAAISEVGKAAFKDCTQIPSSEFLAGADNIAEEAFMNCQRLADTYGLTTVKQVGVRAFMNCYGIQAITLPATLNSVAESAFENCSGILDGIIWEQSEDTSIIANTNITIGSRAFYGCTGIDNEEWAVVIPSQVHSIGSYAFSKCGMKSLKWSNYRAGSYYVLLSVSDTDFASHTFEDCLNLESVISAFPPITGLPDKTFNNCPKLRSVAFLPSTVQSIGRECFSGASLADGIDFSSITSLQTIYEYAFYGCGEPFVVLPQSVRTIQARAFAKNKNLITFNWATDSVHTTTVGEECLAECESLETVSSFGNTQYLPKRCFFLCSSLSSADGIVARVYESGIDDYCFAGCYNLGAITIHENITALGEGCFNCAPKDFLIGNYGGEVEEADREYATIEGFEKWMTENYGDSETDVWQKYDEIIFNPNGSGPTSITFGSNVFLEIGAGCFMNCSRATFDWSNNPDINIPAYTFYNCQHLTGSSNLSWVPDSVESLGKFAFARTDLTDLGRGANSALYAYLSPALFMGCSNLVSLGDANSGLATLFATTPSAIPDACFYGSGLSDISALADAVPVVRLGEFCFAYCASLGSNGGISLDYVTEMGRGCFAYCTAMTQLPVFREGISAFPNQAFKGCTALVSMTDGNSMFPTSVKSLGNECFDGCTSLTGESLNAIGTYLNTIGIRCFRGCSGMVNFHGLPFVYTYPEQCFYGCTGLTQIERLASPSAFKTFAPDWTGAVMQDVEEPMEILFHPWQMGIENGWYIYSITLHTSAGVNANVPSGTYRVAIYDGETRIAVSNSVAVGARDTDYTFPFGSGQYFYAYVNKEYTIKVVGQASYTTETFSLQAAEVGNAESSTPTYYIKGHSNPWLAPVISVKYAALIAPQLGRLAFGNCPKIKTINFTEYSSVVRVVDGGDGDPFDAIPLESNKKNATLVVPEDLIGTVSEEGTYRGNPYWDTFLYIQKGEAPVPPPVEDTPYVKMTVGIPTEGATLYMTGELDILQGGEAKINWGDGSISILERGYTGEVSHQFAASETEYTLTITISGDVLGVYGKFVKDIPDGSTDNYHPVCRPIFSTTKPVGEELTSNELVTEVSFGKDVTSIGLAIFANCPNLTQLDVDSPGVTVIEALAFYSCTNLAYVQFNKGVADLTEIRDMAFAYTGITNLDFLATPTGVVPKLKSLGWACFRETKLVNISKIPTSVTILGAKKSIGTTGLNGACFSRCLQLKSIVGIENTGITSIPTYSFFTCSQLQTIDALPETCTGILPRAFGGCTALTSVVFGKNLSLIGRHAFSSCEKITDIRLLRPETGSSPITTLHATSFWTGLASTTTVRVPPSALTTYQNDSTWTTAFTNIVADT